MLKIQWFHHPKAKFPHQWPRVPAQSQNLSNTRTRGVWAMAHLSLEMLPHRHCLGHRPRTPTLCTPFFLIYQGGK